MATTFDHADADTLALAKGVIKQCYPDLVELGLTYGVIMATAARDKKGEPQGAALKWHGHPAAAVIKINSYAQRVEGLPDVTIKIDADWWREHDELECKALLDSQFAALQPLTDDAGNVLTDDCGRPRIKRRQTDWHMEGYSAPAARNKDHAPEVQALRAFAVSETGQLLMAWG